MSRFEGLRPRAERARPLRQWVSALTAMGLVTLSASALAQPVSADHHLQSRPENLSWGWFPIDKAPVLMEIHSHNDFLK